MKAVVLTTYGPPEGLQIKDVERPAPTAGQVEIRVRATTVTHGDTELRTFDVPWLFWLPLRVWLGLLKPRRDLILGMEISGVIETVGEGVQGFRVGDAVCGTTAMGLGGYAEFVCVAADQMLLKKPETLSFEHAAALPVGGLAALGYLRKGGVAKHKTVLIRGASGSIGTMAVQLAKKHFEAHVTAVCGPEGTARMKALGADVVLDYTRRDFDETDETYDLMLDVVGKLPISACLRAVKDDGAYVRGTIPGLWEVLVGLWTSMTSRRRVVMGDTGETLEDLKLLGRLVAEGTIEPIVDRTYALDQIADAHRYVELGHKQGNVVIALAGPDGTARTGHSQEKQPSV